MGERERCVDVKIEGEQRGKQNQKKVTAFVYPSGLGISNSGRAAKEKKSRKVFFSTLPDKVFFCIHVRKECRKERENNTNRLAR